MRSHHDEFVHEMKSEDIVKLFHDVKPQVMWRMSINIRRFLSNYKDSNGVYLMYMGNDEKCEKFTLLGYPIQIVGEEVLYFSR